MAATPAAVSAAAASAAAAAAARVPCSVSGVAAVCVRMTRTPDTLGGAACAACAAASCFSSVAMRSACARSETSIASIRSSPLRSTPARPAASAASFLSCRVSSSVCSWKSISVCTVAVAFSVTSASTCAVDSSDAFDGTGGYPVAGRSKRLACDAGDSEKIV